MDSTDETEKMTLHNKVKAVLEQLNGLMVGKQAQVHSCVTCLLAGGHLLLEDVPGVGKTTLAQGLAQTFGLAFSRVQFTADLMPSDLTGVSVYERQSESFIFHKGPVFSQVLLADEINRASPKAQSALLEAMEEKQVSAEGQTFQLPHPFFVIATQNPREQLGTHALPESQLDRFLMRVSLGYPNRLAERALLEHNGHRHYLAKLPALLTVDELDAIQECVLNIHASAPVLDYVQDIIDATRSGHWFTQGLSPRAGIAIVRAAKAHAFLRGSPHVAPDDVQAVLVETTAHRLTPSASSERDSQAQILAMLQKIALR